MSAKTHDPFAALDPEIREPLREALCGFVPLTVAALPAFRANTDLFAPSPDALAALERVAIEERAVPGPAGAPAVMVQVMRPAGREGSLPALLWMHGGGYVLGAMADDAPLCALYALRAECVAVNVGYRLAPEDPYPAGLEDCYAALRWLAAEAEELGVDRSRIAVGGASAGGGLAAALALLARDRGEVDVAFQLLVYPMLSDRNVAPPDETRSDTLFWTRGNNLVAWRCYLGREPGSEDVSCYASPSRATELGGLPPAYLAVGDLDLFADEDIAYARDLIRAGVPTELHVYPGGCHGFDALVPEAEISKRFTADLLAALRRALHPAPPPDPGAPPKGVPQP